MRRFNRLIRQAFKASSWIKLFNLLFKIQFLEILRLIIKPESKVPYKRFPKGQLFILTNKHNISIASNLKSLLDRLNIENKLLVGEQTSYRKDVTYIVFAPLAFKRLPKFYFAYQMEQATSTRWFTSRYFRILNKAIAVLDYSLTNIEILDSHRKFNNKIFYLPVGYWEGAQREVDTESRKEFDVVFYGDPSSPRRRTILNEIAKKYNLKVINNLFGKDLYLELAKAKVVINIHYYENALLETTRIFECLSIGSKVVSETTSDQYQYPQLEKLVHFARCGDIEDILFKIENALREFSKTTSLKNLEETCHITQFFFYRFLLSYDLIDLKKLLPLKYNPLQLDKDLICLTLPETPTRFKSFSNTIPNYLSYHFFTGLRHQIGWIGCGMSYKLLFYKALEQNCEKLSICEDDVDFTVNFKHKLRIIHEYLNEQKKDWDIFSGLTTDIHPELRISKIIEYQGLKFIHMNRTTGAVFNIYNQGLIRKMLAWDEKNKNPSNTFDRFLERIDNLKVITTYPPLVNHKDNLESTLWNFHNIKYRKKINNSQNKILQKINEFESETRS